MRLPGFLRRSDPAEAPVVKSARIVTQADVRKAVHAGPATFNRLTRRVYGSTFRWLSPAQQTGEPLTDRYTRRHGTRVLATMGKHRTRRERKEAARVARAMA